MGTIFGVVLFCSITVDTVVLYSVMSARLRLHWWLPLKNLHASVTVVMKTYSNTDKITDKFYFKLTTCSYNG